MIEQKDKTLGEHTYAEVVQILTHGNDSSQKFVNFMMYDDGSLNFYRVHSHNRIVTLNDAFSSEIFHDLEVQMALEVKESLTGVLTDTADLIAGLALRNPKSLTELSRAKEETKSDQT